MTREDFEQWYAQNSGITVEFLHSLGLYAKPCDCKEEGCQGWQMAHRRFILSQAALDEISKAMEAEMDKL